MNEFLLIPATLRMGAPKSDRSTTIKFDTLEIDPAEFAKWHEQNLTFGWMAYSPNVITAKNIPDTAAKGEFKSQSARLRGILAVYWKKANLEKKEGLSWLDFYNRETEKVIDNWLEKLREIDD